MRADDHSPEFFEIELNGQRRFVASGWWNELVEASTPVGELLEALGQESGAAAAARGLTKEEVGRIFRVLEAIDDVTLEAEAHGG